MANMIDGIIIGGAGGAIAGMTVYLVQYIHNKWNDYSDSQKIHIWLSEHSSQENCVKFRSSKAIASYNNMTIDRVRYICSKNEKICLSTGEKDDLWYLRQPVDID
ncbi:hypothetical protein ACXRSW_00520 [Aeromonas dhakensis]|uniref:hypothetical protein n=1 Tax=Aeromonas dhakensis TaxID=196024 RepID=UPI0020B2AC0C|nr:hypothetical protein [Aeromonas dhakensis]CAD7506810.1 hypothetical protein KBAD11_20430 [Aeromonas dhakensis]CAD7510406.1 hypothetical protein KBAD03_10340 [Aeromonas dhakensis]CAD7520604.1 hypothetical protein KBAD14_KBAD14_20430 [Aeromonas dhakensis]CAD7520646.1 hypothetical protein KBAD10_20450 [Aeromonas dhakensis]CAD7525323.1 hypothetical protein KBAD05_20420 [Aeromonas dhakensis]